jgi:thiopeptide-type bacteriocin biosynthesis protein
VAPVDDVVDPIKGRALWEPVFTLVERLRRDDRMPFFFFTRKPPGLRLRFALTRDDEDAVHQIECCLEQLVQEQQLERWFPSVYEPEVFKLGGPDATAAVHEHFSADTRAWWRWQALHREGRTTIDARLLSVCLLNDLFGRFADGPEEVWDVWCHISALHGGSAVSEGPPVPAVQIDDVADNVSDAERALLRDVSSDNLALARRFHTLHTAGRLLFAYRLVLPHLALYHWSRYGFTPADRASMYTPMIRAWSPHRVTAPPLDGGSADARL